MLTSETTTLVKEIAQGCMIETVTIISLCIFANFNFELWGSWAPLYSYGSAGGVHRLHHPIVRALFWSNNENCESFISFKRKVKVLRVGYSVYPNWGTERDLQKFMEFSVIRYKCLWPRKSCLPVKHGQEIVLLEFTCLVPKQGIIDIHLPGNEMSFWVKLIN